MNSTIHNCEYQALWDKAIAAGEAAAQACMPTPVTFKCRAGDAPPKTFHDAEGACGMAWVTVQPGTCAFAQWARRHGLMKSGLERTGVSYFVGGLGSASLARLEAFAHAMRDEFQRAGLYSSVTSRLD